MHASRPSRLTVALLVAALAVCLTGALAPTAARAQSAGRGRVVGKVLATDDGEPVGYADVALVPVDSTQGRRVGVQTNADGTFLLEALPGVYNLRIQAISYSRKLVTGVNVVAGQVKDISVTISAEALRQETVVVEAKAIQNTEAALLARRRRADSVGDAVSAEQVRKSPDRDAGDVLRRVTGTSLVDGKFVFVRGMGERYSSTEMDGVRISSPEQNKRVVPLDMIPSNLLENIVVQKTYTADRPGEFGGGDVQITTRDFPGKRVFNLSLGTGYDMNTTFSDVLGYEGGKGDAFAFGAKSRALPPELERLAGSRKVTNGIERSPYDTMATIGSSFRNQWSPQDIHHALPSNFLLSFGDEVPVAGKSLGVVASVGSSQSLGRAEGRERLYEGAASNLEYDYVSRTYTTSSLFSMLAGVSYRISPAHSISLRGTQARSADDETRTYFGYNASQSSNFSVSRLRYLERVISSLALDGHHEFRRLGGARLVWTASLNRATRQEPDRREVYYRQGLDSDLVPTEPLYFYRASRDWGDLKDDGKGLNARVTIPLRLTALGSREARVDVGGSLQHKDRNSTYRRFDFGNNAGDIDPTAPAESLFADGQWTSTGFPRAYVQESTQPEDSYRAKQGVDAGFVSTDLPLLASLRAVLGARIEHGTQRVGTYDLFSSQVVAEAVLDDWDVLPTANLVWSVSGRTNVRLAAARTLSRPDLRELTPGRTLNFFSGYQDIGNPDLERATIWNYDLRLETFPGLSEVVAVGGFYKDFDRPIEKQIVTGGSDRLLQPMNSDHGHNWGVELEARLALNRLTAKLDRLFLNANGSLIRSSITLMPQTTVTTSAVHPLQGQSNYLANVGLGWTPRSGLDATVLVAAVGRRLYALGIQPVTEDIYQQPSFGLDAVINWSPRPNLRLKFAGRNLTKEGATQMQGDRVVETQDGSRTFAIVAAFGS